ncbi:MAG TPA: hypothetical protein VIJ25_06295 [Methylococcales bacterium]
MQHRTAMTGTLSCTITTLAATLAAFNAGNAVYQMAPDPGSQRAR